MWLIDFRLSLISSTLSFFLHTTFHLFNKHTPRENNLIRRRLFHRLLSVSEAFALNLLLTARSSEAVSLLSVNYHLTVARHYIVDIGNFTKFWLLRAERVQEMKLRAKGDVWRIVSIKGFLFSVHVDMHKSNEVYCKHEKCWFVVYSEGSVAVVINGKYTWEMLGV